MIEGPRAARADELAAVAALAALALKNYVFLFEGWRPLDRELQELEKALPGMRSGGGLPRLPSFLPDKNRIRNSERYITGVESLSRFESRISPMLVGFENGAEAAGAEGASLLPLFLMNLSRCYYEMEDYERSRQYFEKATTADPTLADLSWIETHIRQGHGPLGAVINGTGLVEIAAPESSAAGLTGAPQYPLTSWPCSVMEVCQSAGNSRPGERCRA